LTHPNGESKPIEHVIIVYVTSGGAGIHGKKDDEAVKIREMEANNACKILNATPIFLKLKDGSAFPTEGAISQLIKVFKEHKPRAIFTSWPLDTHADHRTTSYIALEAYARAYNANYESDVKDPMDKLEYQIKLYPGAPALFFWQTMPWRQSLMFFPTNYVCIDSTIDYKMEALEAHASQNRNDKLIQDAEKVATDLGGRVGGNCKYAEGFIRIRPS
jgi:LmbE family N-acetylglucosaminyl deacetylase